MGYTPITTNYAGDDIGEILELLILGAEGFDKGMFHMYTNVQKQKELTKANVNGNLIQPYNAYPTAPAGALAFTNNVLIPFKMTVYDLFNPMDFQSFWPEYQPDGPLAEKEMASAILSVITDLYTKRIGNQIGGLQWQGDFAGSTFTTWNGHNLTAKFNGIVTRAIADASVTKPTANGNLTAANIIAQLTNMDSLMIDAIYREDSYVFHMSTASARLYLTAITNQTYKGQGVSDFTEGSGKTIDTLTFNGRKIMNYTGFPNNYILAAKASTTVGDTHLYAGVNAEKDSKNLIIKQWRPEADLWFLKANFSLDVNYSWSEEMVLYKPV